MPTLLIRYGELGLKSESVRRRFEQALVQDIRRKHLLAKLGCVTSSMRGRLFVDSDDWRRSCELLSKTFGVVSFSPVEKATSELPELLEAAKGFAEPLLSKGASFAVRARRTGNHPYTSQSLAGELGSVILESNKGLELTVDLVEPDIEVFVEVRGKEAYLFSSVMRGPGGMPKGTQGRVLSVVGSERGIASSWLMMKRGCNVTVASEDGSLPSPLAAWNPDLRVVSPEEDLFAQARYLRCEGVALEWGVDDLERGAFLKGDLPVFHPLIGMSQEDVRRLLERVRA
ncbi:MAG: THUMP domain-containing protein [Thermoplasmata archaeon]